MSPPKQLNRHDFDSAVGIKREDLVRYALENSRSLELRQLLASEIRHAAALATIEMNNASKVDSRALLSLLGITPSEDMKMAPHGLPASMRTKELQKLINDYANAFEQLQPFVSACNNSLFLKGESQLSVHQLDELPQKELMKDGSFYYFGAYQAYQTAREQLLTPIEQALMDYSQSEDTYRQYVKCYYAERGRVIFNHHFAGEQTTSMVDVVARMLNATLIIQSKQGAYQTSNFSTTTIKIDFDGVEYQNTHISSAESSIVADELIRKIKLLISDFNKSIQHQSKKNYVQLKSQYDYIIFYLSKPSLVLKASYQGGLHTIREKFGSALLRFNLYVTQSKPFSLQAAQKIYQGFSLFVKGYKAKRAYTDILRGKKFIKAGLGIFNKNKPVGQPNPIAVQSKKNIHNLIEELRKENGGVINKYGLRADEIELFGALLDLPLRMQHATNFYYPALNAGSVDSYTEIKRRNAGYRSPFSTNGNIEKLGNGGFTFFRVYVDPINSDETRYGKTTLVFDINLLRKAGWVSLHDQLKPFPSKNTWRFYSGKRLLRTSQEVAIHSNTKDKSLLDGNQYRYRTTSISSYDQGTLDTQKSFGTAIATSEVTRSFLEEIFFGEDILIGIALSVIRELRHLEKCGFRHGFLTLFNQYQPEKKSELLGNLIKDLFRIEGKYPVSLKVQASLSDNTPRFSEYVNTRDRFTHREFEVINPDGDGRYHVEGSVNTEADELARLADRKKFIEDELHTTRRQAGRKNNNAQKWIQKTKEFEQELLDIQQRQQEDRNVRQEVVQYFISLFEVDQNRFSKIDTAKLTLLQDAFHFILEDPETELDEVLAVSMQQLTMLSQEPFYELLENSWVLFSEATECTLKELENLSEYNLKKPIRERDMTLSELIKLYNENPMHLFCLTCDDLTDYILENTPDIDPIVLQYAREEDVDFNYILGELGPNERMLFQNNLGLFSDVDESDEYDEYDENDFHEPEDDYPSEENEYLLTQFKNLSLPNEKTKEKEVEQTHLQALQTFLLPSTLDKKKSNRKTS